MILEAILICHLGDSLSTPLWSFGPEVENSENRIEGEPGTTAANWKPGEAFHDRVEPCAFGADVVSITLGTNDGFFGVTRTRFAQNVGELMDVIDEPVVLWEVSPYRGIGVLCDRESVSCIDMTTLLADPDDTVDGIHPTQSGKVKLAEAFVQAVPEPQYGGVIAALTVFWIRIRNRTAA